MYRNSYIHMYIYIYTNKFEIIFHMIYLCFLSELQLSQCTGNLLEGSASGCEGSSKSVVSARNTRNIGRFVAFLGCSFFIISIYTYIYIYTWYDDMIIRKMRRGTTANLPGIYSVSHTF